MTIFGENDNKGVRLNPIDVMNVFLYTLLGAIATTRVFNGIIEKINMGDSLNQILQEPNLDEVENLFNTLNALAFRPESHVDNTHNFSFTGPNMIVRPSALAITPSPSFLSINFGGVSPEPFNPQTIFETKNWDDGITIVPHPNAVFGEPAQLDPPSQQTIDAEGIISTVQDKIIAAFGLGRLLSNGSLIDLPTDAPIYVSAHSAGVPAALAFIKGINRKIDIFVSRSGPYKMFSSDMENIIIQNPAFWLGDHLDPSQRQALILASPSYWYASMNPNIIGQVVLEHGDQDLTVPLSQTTACQVSLMHQGWNVLAYSYHGDHQPPTNPTKSTFTKL